MPLIQSVIQQFKQQLETKKIELLQRTQRLTHEDPFNDPNRTDDNAAIDTDAAEQFGHETSVAMREEIDKKLVDIDRALERIQAGSFGLCSACNQEIDQKRLDIEPTAAYCMACQQRISVVDVG